MRHLAGHRSRGQTFSLAAVGMVAVIGALAMVVDAGIFFVIQRQFQSAADAGALAGAWYQPVCVTTDVGCLSSRDASDVAREVATANAAFVTHMCTTPLPPPTVSTGTRLNLPARVNAIVVTVECDAAYSFGGILGLRATKISASSAASIGMRRLDTRVMGDFPVAAADCEYAHPTAPNQPPCLIARLIE
jgi:uncharacterized membrane protein